MWLWWLTWLLLTLAVICDYWEVIQMSEVVDILMNDGSLTEDEALDLIEEEGMEDLLDE